jgi:hypothetical protein
VESRSRAGSVDEGARAQERGALSDTFRAPVTAISARMLAKRRAVSAARTPTRIAGVGTITRSATCSWLAAIVSLLVSACASPVAVAPEAEPRTRSHVMALASDATEGRATGSAGERRAADYIIAELKRIGARPLPGMSDYRLPFEFAAGARDGGSSVDVSSKDATGAMRFAARADVQALSFSDDATVSGPVVFAGYGIVVPPNQELTYDSYGTLDVKDKIVVVLRYFPEGADRSRRSLLARYSDLRFKATAARQRGAKAMLIVTGPRSPNAGAVVPMAFDPAIAGSGIPAVSIGPNVARALFASSPQTLEDAQRALDAGEPRAGWALPGVTATVSASVVREKRAAANVVAYLPATRDTGNAQKPWIALGAHYDHLGRGQVGNSLADKDEHRRVHFGADDNASGVAAVLAIAERLSSQQRGRHVLLAFWSGEEIGLLGSAAFVRDPPIPVSRVAAYLNFDMVGRMQTNRLIVQATGTSPVWPGILRDANKASAFELSLQASPYQPTDVSSFNQAGVPTLNFFTGAHPDYHRPGDTADKINYPDLERLAAFAAAIATRIGALEDAPAFVKVEEPAPARGRRAGVRVFTGTIPDYAADAKGLLIGGVIGGGPADEAGLRKGDLIVEIAGQSIANIYDYTYAIDTLKPGEPAKVVYLRRGERKETLLTPVARNR